jgi:hypothetical protein
MKHKEIYQFENIDKDSRKKIDTLIDGVKNGVKKNLLKANISYDPESKRLYFETDDLVYIRILLNGLKVVGLEATLLEN